MTKRFMLLLAGAVALSGCSIFEGVIPAKSSSNADTSYTASHSGNYATNSQNASTNYVPQPRYYFGTDLPVKTAVSGSSAYKSYNEYNTNNRFAGSKVEIFPTGTTSSPVSTAQTYTAPSSKRNTRSAVPALRGVSSPRFYGNLGATLYDIGDGSFGVIARAGIDRGILGAELEGTVGLTNETETIGDMRVSGGVNHSVGIFGVARHKFTSKWSALGRLGYHSAEVGAKTRNVNGGAALSNSASFDGIAYGAGVEYNLNSVNGVRFDYTRYDYDDIATSDTVSATYLRRF